jgi:hypothetical protein
MSSAFSTAYNPVGAGANYAYVTMGSEDDLFHNGAKNTQWRQRYNKYTPHQGSMVLQSIQNQGLGHNMTCPLIKTPDFLYSSYVAQFYPAIAPNVDAGVQDASWVNAAALYSLKGISLKVGSQPLFQLNGHAMLVLLELGGDLEKYASLIGFCKTKSQLIANSRRDQTLFAPFIGFPFQGRPDLAYSIGCIAFHGVTCDIQSRPLNEMVVNYGGLNSKKGLYALPKEIRTDAPIAPTSVQFTLATNVIWVSAEERYGLIHGYNESIFRECIVAAEHTIQASSTQQRLAFDLNIKGPCAFIAVTIQSRADLDNGNHTKLCQDSGEDWIKEIMLVTGSTPREDGLPASFYRTGKVIECFKTSISRHVYVISFETDATSRQMTGHQNMTNCEKLQLSALYVPHASPLEVTALAVVYNGWYTENGSGGRVWN